MGKLDSGLRALTVLLLSIALALIALATLVNLPYQADDPRLLHLCCTDEHLITTQLLDDFEKRTPHPDGFYNYGYLYHSIITYAALTLGEFGFRIHGKSLILLARSLSWVSFGIALVLLFFLLFSRLKIPALIAFSFTLIFGLYGPNLYWSHHIHPDQLMVVLVIATILISLSGDRLPTILLSALTAGLAFGTKQTGIFILPFIFLPSSFRILFGEEAPWKEKFKALAVNLGIGFTVFLLAWLLSNPTVLSNFREFLQDLRYEMKHTGRGHDRQEAFELFGWIRMLWLGFHPVGSLIVGLGTLSSLVWLGRNLNQAKGLWKSYSTLNSNLTLAVLYLSLYAFACLVYMTLKVRMLETRFLMHLTPAFVTLAAVGWTVWIPKNKKWIQSVLALVLTIGVFAQMNSAMRTPEMAKTSHADLHPRIQVGRKFQNYIPSETKILSNPYAYVPSKFQNVHFVWRFSRDWLESYKPDALIITASATRRHIWKKPGTQWKDRDFVIGKTDHAPEVESVFREILFSDQSPWEVAHEEYGIVLLVKR